MIISSYYYLKYKLILVFVNLRHFFFMFLLLIVKICELLCILAEDILAKLIIFCVHEKNFENLPLFIINFRKFLYRIISEKSFARLTDKLNQYYSSSKYFKLSESDDLKKPGHKEK